MYVTQHITSSSYLEMLMCNKEIENESERLVQNSKTKKNNNNKKKTEQTN